jgi:hypothetical protein
VTINELVTAVNRSLGGCRDDGVCDPITEELAQCNTELAQCTNCPCLFFVVPGPTKMAGGHDALGDTAWRLVITALGG